MWWEEFEQQLNWAYATIDRQERREVHSDQQKLRHLLSRVKAPFLNGVIASIHVRLNHHGEIVPYTYADALSAIRTAVNEQHPPTFNSNNNTRRHIRAANARTGGGRGGRGGRGRGYGGYGRGFGLGGRGGAVINTRLLVIFIPVTVSHQTAMVAHQKN